MSARLQAASTRLWLILGPTLARAAPLLLVSLVLAGAAEARVGGGHSYGGGSRGGYSGGSRSGGSSGGGGDLIGMLIWLCIRHPAIGIPTVIVFVAFVVVKGKMRSRGMRRGPVNVGASRPARRAPPTRRATQALKRADPNFSTPLFVDFAQLVHVRGRTLAATGDLEGMRAWFSEGAITELRRTTGGTAVRDVIFGATRVETVRVDREWSRLTAFFETNLTEQREGGETQRLRQERWVFRRKAGVLSPGPSGMRALGCPACGSTLEPTPEGRCPNCQTVRTGGAVQWEVSAVTVLQDRPLSAPDLHLGGGVEPGTRAPSIRDPELSPRLRALVNRHPDWSTASFEQRAVDVFHTLQRAWSEQKWETARPYQTDALFQIHRFWMERYRRAGLVNKLADVAALRIELVKVDQDAWYESVTVRIWGRMKDWTERKADGKVVGGSKSEDRVFTEYWTFVRAVGAEQREASHDLNHCPSCGAPLDQVSMAGVCGYCDTKITGGDFDWILSRIEQDDAYAG